VKLASLDGDDGGVLATVQGWGAHAWARWDQSIGGSHWETPRDMPRLAYAMPSDDPTLIDDLRAEGYKLDLSEYAPPGERGEHDERAA